MATVGVCEDDASLREIIRRALEREGLRVVSTGRGADAVRSFSACTPQVIVLDIGLPDADGRDVCQALRARGVTSPVLFLTARDALPDRLSGFHAGGDDYLVKPFALSELAVRVQALIRRSGGPDLDTGGELGAILDPAGHGILGEEPVSLTPTEYRLLAALCVRPGSAVRRHTLVAAGWPHGAIVADNTLDAYISRIRGKLRQAGRSEAIANVRGVGYRLA